MADNIKAQEQHHLDGVIKKIKIAETSLEKKIKATKKESREARFCRFHSFSFNG